MILDPRTTDRLTKLLGMLGSDHAGERANAAAQADKLLRAHGLTWREWIERQPTARLEPRSIEDIIDFCLSHRPALNDWEREFLGDINRKVARGLSQRQIEKIKQIYVKVKAYVDLATECDV